MICCLRWWCSEKRGSDWTCTTWRSCPTMSCASLSWTWWSLWCSPCPGWTCWTCCSYSPWTCSTHWTCSWWPGSCVSAWVSYHCGQHWSQDPGHWSLCCLRSSREYHWQSCSDTESSPSWYCSLGCSLQVSLVEEVACTEEVDDDDGEEWQPGAQEAGDWQEWWYQCDEDCHPLVQWLLLPTRQHWWCSCLPLIWTHSCLWNKAVNDSFI